MAVFEATPRVTRSISQPVLLTFATLIVLPLQGSQSPIRHYTTDDGLASNRINRIVHDSRGFLWFCTREGISRFDGYQFTNFGREQGLPVPDNDLLETREGDYWIATDDGLARLSLAGAKPAFDLYRPFKPEARIITALVEDGAGGIWCATEAGLYHLERAPGSSSEKRSQYKLGFVDIGMPSATWSDGVIEALIRDRDGNLWMGGPSGLYRRTRDGKHRKYKVGDGPTRNHVTSLLEDHAGRLWAGTWGGLCRISTKTIDSGALVEKAYTMKDGLPGNLVEALLESSDGHLWIGTAGGLSRYAPDTSPEEFENITVSNGLGNGEVSAVGEDRAGNLWAGSTGADRISRGGFVTYGEEDGLASNSVQSIFEDRQGELCVTTQVDARRCLNRFDGRRFHRIVPNIPPSIDNWGWGRNQLSFQDHTGQWWVPTAEGLFRFPQSPMAQLSSARPNAFYNAANGLDGSIFVIFEDSRDDVWISSQPSAGRQLWRWERATGTLHKYSADGIADGNLAQAFAEDRAGNVWIGFWNGLARYRNGRFQAFEAPKGIEHFYVRAIYPDLEGRMWLACRDGVVRIDSPEAEAPQFTAYTTAQGLSSNDAQAIVEDQWGRIYVGTGRGVDCFFPRTPLHVKHYLKSDGVALGPSMSAFRDRHGALWFGTPSGLSRLQPEPEGPPTPPPVMISALRVRGSPRPVSPLGETALPAMVFGPDQNQIEVEYVGLGFGTGERLRYQYRLDNGETEEWSEPGDERRISFARLTAGNYRLLVRALTDDGLVSAKPATVQFTVLAAVWQRWWVRALALLLIAATLYMLYRYRLARVLEIERLRTRIATDLHDDLGSTLSQIAILSEVAGRQTGRQDQHSSLSEIADLARESVDSMSDIVWAIDPEKDRLGDLSHRMRRFAGDLFNGTGTQVHYRGPDEEPNPAVETEMRRHVFLIFKESLHNAARHAACTEVEIDFRLDESWLLLNIHDNGKGFDPGQVNRGHGLASIEHRADQLAAELHVKSSPGCGTSLSLRVPFRQSAPSRKMGLHKGIG